jgi:hypothetical protein
VPATALPTVSLVVAAWLGIRFAEPALKEAVIPDDGDTETLTVPENPPILVRVMSSLTREPAWVEIEDWLVVILKSITVTDTATNLERDPAAAVTVTVNDPAEDEVIIRVEVPVPDGVRLTMVALRLATPVLDAAIVTGPLKPLMLVKVKVVELEKPACTVSERELAARAKSGAEPTIIAIVTDRGDPPPVPVTVTE